MVNVGHDVQNSVALAGKLYSALGRTSSDVGSTKPIGTSNSQRTNKAKLID